MRTRFPLLITVLFLLSACGGQKEQPVHFSDFTEAGEYLATCHPSLEGWCVPETLPRTRIAVDTKNKALLFLEADRTDTIRFSSQAGSYDIMHCQTQDTARLNILLRDWFGLDGTVTDADTMNVRLEANLRPVHLAAIRKSASTSPADKALSVLYNACVGNAGHDPVLACRDKKLVHAGESFYGRETLSFIDTAAFFALMNSGIDFAAIPSPQAFADTLAKHRVLKQTTRDYDFVFYDIRGDKVYFGDTAVSHREPKLHDFIIAHAESPKSIFIHRRNTEDFKYETLDGRLKEMEGLQPCTVDPAKLQGTAWPGEPEQETGTGQDGKGGKGWMYLLTALLGIALGAALPGLWRILKRNLPARVKKETPQTEPSVPEETEPQEAEPFEPEPDTEEDFPAKFERLKSQFDKLEKDYNKLIQQVKTQDPDRKLFDRLTGAQTESELTEALAEIRKRYPSLPAIDTVAALAGRLKRDQNPSKQIDDVLRQVDRVAGTDLAAAQSSFIKRTVLYDKCAKMIDGTDSAHDIPSVLKKALEAFQAAGQTPDAAADFVRLFKPAVPDMKEKDDILREYNALRGVAKDFREAVSPVSRKEALEFWDRAALVLSSVSECAVSLLDIVDPGNKLKGQREEVLQQIKEDLLVAYIARFFLSGAQNGDVSAETFRKTVAGSVSEAVGRHNADIAKGRPGLAIRPDESDLEEALQVLVEAIDKNRKYEATLPFIDGIWEAFVKEFLEKARDCNDKAFIMESVLNIAYHTADFLAHVKGGKDIPYCYNYAFLLSGFDPGKADALPFRHNDYRMSTTYSNFLYELAGELGVEHLKILIDNYFIKP